jgi:enoyl-[acyl-carrier protein] reductase II
MLAAMCLGADGVQMGTRFALTEESAANLKFKELCIALNEGDTVLSLKKLSPVRLIKNAFYNRVQEVEDKGATVDELRDLLGKGRSRLGIFEGDLVNGELEIGQVASSVKAIEKVETVMQQLIAEYEKAKFQIRI